MPSPNRSRSPPARWFNILRSVTLFSTPATQTALAPGRFARVELPVSGAAGSSRLTVPQQAVVRRAELTAVYVLRAKGAPELRYVRLGDSLGSDVEVLAGLRAGERVVTTPEAAARRTGGR